MYDVECVCFAFFIMICRMAKEEDLTFLSSSTKPHSPGAPFGKRRQALWKGVHTQSKWNVLSKSGSSYPTYTRKLLNFKKKIRWKLRKKCRHSADLRSRQKICSRKSCTFACKYCQCRIAGYQHKQRAEHRLKFWSEFGLVQSLWNSISEKSVQACNPWLRTGEPLSDHMVLVYDRAPRLGISKRLYRLKRSDTSGPEKSCTDILQFDIGM